MDCCYPLKVSISEDMYALRKQIKFIRQVGANEVDFGDLPSVLCLKVMRYEYDQRIFLNTLIIVFSHKQSGLMARGLLFGIPPGQSHVLPDAHSIAHLQRLWINLPIVL